MIQKKEDPSVIVLFRFFQKKRAVGRAMESITQCDSWGIVLFHTFPTPLMQRLFPTAYHWLLLITSLFFLSVAATVSLSFLKVLLSSKNNDPISRKLFQKKCVLVLRTHNRIGSSETIRAACSFFRIDVYYEYKAFSKKHSK